MLAKGFFESRPEELEPSVEGFEFYLDAFRELGSCRPGGLDIQPIPFTAIYEYSRIYHIAEGDDFEDFLYVIRRLDNEYLDLRAAEVKKETGPKPKGNKSASKHAGPNNTGNSGHKR